MLSVPASYSHLRCNTMAQNIDPVNERTGNSNSVKDGDGPTSAPKHQSTSKRYANWYLKFRMFNSHNYLIRLQQELLTLMMSGDKGISAFPNGDDMFSWIGTIHGPQGTVINS